MPRFNLLTNLQGLVSIGRRMGLQGPSEVGANPQSTDIFDIFYLDREVECPVVPHEVSILEMKVSFEGHMIADSTYRETDIR